MWGGSPQQTSMSLMAIFAKAAGRPESGLCENWIFEQLEAIPDRLP
jgi:hypothetical protein